MQTFYSLFFNRYDVNQMVTPQNGHCFFHQLDKLRFVVSSSDHRVLLIVCAHPICRKIGAQG